MPSGCKVLKGEKKQAETHNQEMRILVACGTQKTCRGIHDAWQVQFEVRGLCATTSATRSEPLRLVLDAE